MKDSFRMDLQVAVSLSGAKRPKHQAAHFAVHDRAHRRDVNLLIRTDGCDDAFDNHGHDRSPLRCFVSVLVSFLLRKFRGLASPVALAPGELGALTQPRSPTHD